MLYPIALLSVSPAHKIGGINKEIFLRYKVHRGRGACWVSWSFTCDIGFTCSLFITCTTRPLTSITLPGSRSCTSRTDEPCRMRFSDGTQTRHVMGSLWVPGKRTLIRTQTWLLRATVPAEWTVDSQRPNPQSVPTKTLHGSELFFRN